MDPFARLQKARTVNNAAWDRYFKRGGQIRDLDRAEKAYAEYLAALSAWREAA
jgi:hypothetical protein